MAHIHEKIDYTVEVFIVYKNKVLLRRHEKYDIWLSVGGHIELDETPEQTAVREVKEEVGLDILLIGNKKGIGDGSLENKGHQDLIPPKYLGIHPINDTHQHLTFIYFATSTTDKILEPLNENEKAETRWFSYEELERMELTPVVLFYAREALKELSMK
jgi:8-oxo-dGTP pyrophosphatase MutT (NUDIX family)